MDKNINSKWKTIGSVIQISYTIRCSWAFVQYQRAPIHRSILRDKEGCVKTTFDESIKSNPHSIKGSWVKETFSHYIPPLLDQIVGAYMNIFSIVVFRKSPWWAHLECLSLRSTLLERDSAIENIIVYSGWNYKPSLWHLDSTITADNFLCMLNKHRYFMYFMAA